MWHRLEAVPKRLYAFDVTGSQFKLSSLFGWEHIIATEGFEFVFVSLQDLSEPYVLWVEESLQYSLIYIQIASTLARKHFSETCSNLARCGLRAVDTRVD